MVVASVFLLLFVACSETTTPVEEPPDGEDTYGFRLYRYGTEFYGMWMFSATEWIGVAADGIILHYDDGVVTLMPSGTRNQLNDIWASGPNDIFVVGEQYQSADPGTILHYDGTSWTQMNFTTQEDVNGVFGLSPTNVYAVTEAGRVFHYDGSVWTEEYQRPGGHPLNDVWASGLNNVVAVGDLGGIVRWDGESWSDDSVMGPDFTGVWGAAYNDIYVCGYEQIWHYDIAWGISHSASGLEFEEVHGTGSDDVWAVGFGNVIMHWDGTSWSDESTGNENDFHAVWAYSPTHVVTLSDHGGVYEYSPSGWEEINNSQQGSFSDMYGLSADEIYAVSGYYLMLWDGVEWAVESTHSAYKRAVWATGTDEVWSSGWPGSGAPRYVYYYDGSSWTNSYSVDWIAVVDVCAADANNVFAALDEGTVAYYDGTSWDSTQVNPSLVFYGIWAASATDVFVVGEVGTIYHYDGTDWTDMSVPGADYLESVWGTSANDVVAVGRGGEIVRYDGTQWTRETSGTDEVLRDVWGDAPDNYWAVGYRATALRYDGTGWTQMETGLSDDFSIDCVWGTGNDVWLSADNDHLLRYELLE
jgi:hypothetical protein